MPNKKLRHHFVAKSYFQGFARRGMLWGWFRESNEIRDVHIVSIAKEKGFYDLLLADGTPSDELEDALASVDGMTPDIIRRATSSPPNSEALDGVRSLYATTLSRNHQGRDLLLTPAAETLSRVSEMYDADFPESTAEQRRWALDYVMRDVYEVPKHLSADPDTISRLNILKLAADLLSVMPKSVCILRSGAQNFFTSDAPCAFFDPAKERPAGGEYSGPSDWDSPTLELTLPLDNRHAALIANRRMPRSAKVNLDGVRVINARTAFFAKRVVLACPTEDNENETALFIAQVVTERKAFDTPLLAAFE